MTRWLDCFSIFDRWQQWKLAQKCHKFAQVGSAFCQIRNKLSKFCQRLINFCQSGEFSPNLVSLVVALGRTPIDEEDNADSNSETLFTDGETDEGSQRTVAGNETGKICCMAREVASGAILIGRETGSVSVYDYNAASYHQLQHVSRQGGRNGSQSHQSSQPHSSAANGRRT